MKAVIFDFDGTIADSSYVWEKVDRDFFAKRDMEVPSDYVDAISTMSFYSGAVYTKDKYNLPESVEEIMAEWSSHALHEYKNNVLLKPYTKEYITKLYSNDVKIGLATASNPEFYTPVLKRAGIYNMFSAFADGSDNVRNKDYPDLYLLCAKRLGVEPKACTVYEDVIKGVKSAMSANMNVVAVYDNHRSFKWQEIINTAHRHIKNFGELM